MTNIPRLVLLLAPALLAGCASAPVQMMRNPVYQGIGAAPAWQVAVGRRSIVLRLGEPGARASAHRYPGIRRGARGLKSWDAGDGIAVISVDARPGPCAHGDLVFEDHVRVRLSGRELAGCGGRLLGRERR